jgi:hypothetical protein
MRVPPHRAAAVALPVGLVLLGGCADGYAEAEGALREWLAAVESADPAGCTRETERFRDDILGTPATEERCVATDPRPRGTPWPSSDDAMEVPVWDPSGEAIVEVTTDDGEVVEFWMFERDGRWLVDGVA